jgi:hypothetical protein
MIREALITFCGQPAKVNCDGRCDKAWGHNSRPKIYDPKGDENDYYEPADHELGTAPTDPGTYEGDHAKPLSPDDFPNKWCVRECERCNISEPGKSAEPLEVKDWSRRHSNYIFDN